jgi:hypothetical protein
MRKPKSELQPLAYSIAGACKVLNLRRSCLTEAAKIGDLKIYRAPTTSTVRILRCDLEAWFRTSWAAYYG